MQVYYTKIQFSSSLPHVQTIAVSGLARWKWKVADEYVLQYLVSALIAQHDPLGKK